MTTYYDICYIPQSHILLLLQIRLTIFLYSFPQMILTLRSDTHGPVHHSFSNWAIIIDRGIEILHGFVFVGFTL